MAGNVDWRFRVARWMAGRNGMDDLSRGLFVACIALVVVNLLFHSSLLSIFALFLFLLGVVRTLSRNVPARMKENRVYNGLMVKPRAWWARMNAQADDRRARAQASGRRTPRTPNAQASPRSSRWPSASGQSKASATSEASKGAVEYLFFVCEGCGQRLTVPKGKGKLRTTCPKCGHVVMRES